MGLLQDKTILITGGARSMGANHVRRCAQEGARVVFGDVLEEEGRALAAEIGETAVFVKHDVCDPDGWQEIVQVAEQQFGGLDVLVNNAAIHLNCPMENETADSLRRHLEVNVVGSFQGAKAVLPAMRPRGGGSIINISSLAGIRGIWGYSAYGASKWAVRGMTQVWAQELGPDNIRVNAIMPGAISETSMFSLDEDPQGLEQIVSAIPLRRTGKPDDVSDVVIFLASDKSSYMTGTEQVIDGGRAIW